MEKELLKEKAHEIIELVNSNFTNREGILIKIINDSRGEILDEIIIDDLGDFIPFLAYFSDEEICQRHLNYIKKNINNLGFDRAFSYTDLLFGLIWYSKIGQAKEMSLELAFKLADQVINKFFKNRVSSYTKFNAPIPLFNTLDLTFIEVFTELYRIRKEQKYLQIAEILIDKISANDFFKKNHLVPEIIIESPVLNFLKLIYKSKFSQAEIMKNNTNFGFALLDFWRITHDDKVKKVFNLLYDGLKYNVVEKNNLRNIIFSNKQTQPDLSPSFAITDLMSDAFVLFKEEKYLDLAKQVAHLWMKLQANETGLLPRYATSKYSYLDCETDMSIALFKLWEITNDKKYYQAALRIIEGVFKFHKSKRGYILQVNIDTGSKGEEGYKTKHQTLFLKPIIYLLSGKRVYQDNLIFTLMKDR